jgi:hypothetical protein
MVRRRAFLALLGLSACGGAAPQPPAALPDDLASPAPTATPRNSHQVAASVVSAKLTALIHVDRVRGHALAPQVANLDAWGPIFDGTGIEPLEDVDRAFVAAANVKDRKAVIAVAEHHVEAERIEKAIDTLVERSGENGKRLDGFDFSAARVKIKGRESIIMAVTPSLLVVTSEHYANAAKKLAETGGLPEPDATEAVLAEADQPYKTLKASRAPKIPSTITHAKATVTMKKDGSADLIVVADSSDAAQAKKDAAALTKAIDKATTVKISVIKIRAFAPVEFEAEGSQVVADRHVTKSELSTLIGFAQML